MALNAFTVLLLYCTNLSMTSAHSITIYAKDTETAKSTPAESISKSLRGTGESIKPKPAISDNLLKKKLTHEKATLNNVMLEPRIIGGSEAPVDRYPYIASLNYFGSHICGGSLVAPDMVLSAAHCAGYATTVELGRHDRTSTDNSHESIDVAYEIKHPEYNSQTVDNDFMMVKITQPSSHPLIILNEDPELPSQAGSPLTIMGWGDTDAHPDVFLLSDALKEAQLTYIPNDQCRSAEGYVGENNDFVTYRSMITDNMMCAQDEFDDTCQGDSGSPMIIPGNGPNGEDDVQVGVVSWGIGCASPVFPGVYSRVSAQMQWITEMICEHSQYAPVKYGCEGSNSTVLPISDDDETSRSYVTLEVSLDSRPGEFSWVLSTLRSKDVIATVPPTFYTGYENFTFHHKIEVVPDQFYRISLRDSSGDGLKGYVAAYRSAAATFTNLIMFEPLFYEPDTKDAKSIDHAFYTGKDPPNYLSLAIKFDKYPKDVWWKLESVSEGVILAQRPPHWYNERFELLSVVETIPLLGNDHGDQTYRFTIGDSYPCVGAPTEICGDGICCEYGEGEYKLFSGPVADDVLLASGGDYQLFESMLIRTGTDASSL